MKFAIVIPYVDRGFGIPQVWSGYIEASTVDEAMASSRVAYETRTLMDLIVGRSTYLSCAPELSQAPDDELDDGYGIDFGEPRVFAVDDAEEFVDAVKRASVDNH